MSWVALALLGGVVGLDATSFPQIMISRPIVAATLAGLVLGHPGLGFAFGVVLEAFHLAVLPIGAARYPEAGTAAAAGAFALVTAGTGVGPAPLLITLGFALVWGRVAAASVEASRHASERVVRAAEPEVGPAGVEIRHMVAMAIDFGRGAFITVTGGAIGWLLLRAVAAGNPPHPVIAQGALVVLLCGAAAGALTVFGGMSERKASFVAGAAVGTLIAVFA
jgi:PTS system mannose-specific IIC component